MKEKKPFLSVPAAIGRVISFFWQKMDESYQSGKDIEVLFSAPAWHINEKGHQKAFH